MKRLMLAAGLVLAATVAGAAEPVTCDDGCDCCGGRTQLFDTEGDHIGVAIEVGNTTLLYFDNGTRGSVRFKGNMAIYYDARGKKIFQEKTR
jgi:hypothetical protein